MANKKRKYYAMEWQRKPFDSVHIPRKGWHYLGSSVSFPDKFLRDAWVANARSHGRNVQPVNATAAEKAQRMVAYTSTTVPIHTGKVEM